MQLCAVTVTLYCRRSQALPVSVWSALDALVMCVDVSQCWPELLRGLKYFGRSAARVTRLSAAPGMCFSGHCANITSTKSKPSSQARLMQVRRVALFCSNESTDGWKMYQRKNRIESNQIIHFRRFYYILFFLENVSHKLLKYVFIYAGYFYYIYSEWIYLWNSN